MVSQRSPNFGTVIVQKPVVWKISFNKSLLPAFGSSSELFSLTSFHNWNLSSWIFFTCKDFILFKDSPPSAQVVSSTIKWTVHLWCHVDRAGLKNGNEKACQSFTIREGQQKMSMNPLSLKQCASYSVLLTLHSLILEYLDQSKRFCYLLCS